MKSHILKCLFVLYMLFTLSACNLRIILNTVGSPKQMGSFVKPIALKDTVQVANYIGGHIESSTVKRKSKSADGVVAPPSEDEPNVLQGAFSFYQYRERLSSQSKRRSYYTSFGGSVYGGRINPKDHYGDLPFKSLVNPYANKYFMGFNASVDFGFTYFFSIHKTGLSVSNGVGFGIYYEPFGSVRQLVDEVDLKVLEKTLEEGTNDLEPWKTNLFILHSDIRYTYPNRKGAVGVTGFITLGGVVHGVRGIGLSAYAHRREFYFDVQITQHTILFSPLISLGVQYQLSLKKKRKIVQIKKRSFWSRVLDPYELF